MRFTAWLVAALVAAVTACGTPPRTPVVAVPSWPLIPEPLPNAIAGPADVVVTCDGRTFPFAGLGAPPGAETASGPEYDAMRATLVAFADAFPGSDDWTWRLAGRDDAGAIFLARTDTGLISIEVTADATGWKPSTMGDCDPHVVLSSEFGPASWAINPAFPAPDADTVVLNILVWERACSGGSPATGRMSAPVVQYTPTTVTITIGVRPLEVAPGTLLNCGGPPGTPASVRLPEPPGHRTLLDGGHIPPVPPTPAVGG
jgi:hypothetical protein